MFSLSKISYKCLYILCIVFYIFELVESVDPGYKPKKRTASKEKRGRKRSEDVDLSTGFYIVVILFLALIIPTTIYFLYTVAQDPATPTLLNNAWAVAKEKYFGYIGKGSTAGKRKKSRIDYDNEFSVKDS